MTDRFDTRPEVRPFAERRAIATAAQYRPSEDATKRIAEAAKTQNDWFATCQVCKASLSGTPEEILKHRHG